MRVLNEEDHGLEIVRDVPAKAGVIGGKKTVKGTRQKKAEAPTGLSGLQHADDLASTADLMDAEHNIWLAAVRIKAEGISVARFLKFCGAAMWAAGRQGFYFSDVHADCGMHVKRPDQRPMAWE